jgi:hypothetical protein
MNEDNISEEANIWKIDGVCSVEDYVPFNSLES